MNATSSRLRRRIAAFAAAVTLPSLAACGVSFGAQTDQVYDPADGVNARGGEIDVLNALIVSDRPGTGRLIAGLSNQNTEESDAVTGVRGAGEDQGVTFSLAGGTTTIRPGGMLQLANSDAADIIAKGDAVKAGGFVRLTFTFQNAQEATLDVPVLEPDETYKDVQLPGRGTSSSTGTPSPVESPIPSQTADSSTSSDGGTSSGVPSPSPSSS